jgi:hypothetical protein
VSFFVDASALYALLDQLLPVVKIVDVDEGLRRRAIAASRASVSSNVSLVDRTSFEFMRTLGLRAPTRLTPTSSLRALNSVS